MTLLQRPIMESRCHFTLMTTKLLIVLLILVLLQDGITTMSQQTYDAGIHQTNDENAALLTFANTTDYPWNHSRHQPPLQNTQPTSNQPFSFYVMGDTPYRRKDSVLLFHQMEELYQDKYLAFIFHVGDLMRHGDCSPWRYQHAAKLLFHWSSINGLQPPHGVDARNATKNGVPILVLPGDNDWLECPDRILAFTQFKTHFIWNNPSIVTSNDTGTDESFYFRRQVQRMENFVLWKDSILFFGLNMLGRRDGLWRSRYELNIQWFQSQFQNITRTIAQPIRLIAILAHSAAARPVYHYIRKFTQDINIPVLYIHGNGHVFLMNSEREDFVKIQLDRGGIAPPLRVQVYGNECQASPDNSTNPTTFSLFSGLVCIDRRL